MSFKKPLILKVFFRGSRDCKVFEIRQFPCTIGRNADCDLQITDDSVSSNHLIIEAEGEWLKARDQRSSNGTRYGGIEQKSKFVLDRNIPITLGGVRIEIELPYPAVGAARVLNLRSARTLPDWASPAMVVVAVLAAILYWKHTLAPKAPFHPTIEALRSDLVIVVLKALPWVFLAKWRSKKFNAVPIFALFFYSYSAALAGDIYLGVLRARGLDAVTSSHVQLALHLVILAFVFGMLLPMVLPRTAFWKTSALAVITAIGLGAAAAHFDAGVNASPAAARIPASRVLVPPRTVQGWLTFGLSAGGQSAGQSSQ